MNQPDVERMMDQAGRVPTLEAEIDRLTAELNDAEAVHKELWCKLDTALAENSRKNELLDKIYKLAVQQWDDGSYGDGHEVC